MQLMRLNWAVRCMMVCTVFLFVLGCKKEHIDGRAESSPLESKDENFLFDQEGPFAISADSMFKVTRNGCSWKLRVKETGEAVFCIPCLGELSDRESMFVDFKIEADDMRRFIRLFASEGFLDTDLHLGEAPFESPLRSVSVFGGNGSSTVTAHQIAEGPEFDRFANLWKELLILVSSAGIDQHHIEGDKRLLAE